MSKKKSTAPARQTERVMLALTPDELAELEQAALRMGESLGIIVPTATAARALLLAGLRKGLS